MKTLNSPYQSIPTLLLVLDQAGSILDASDALAQQLGCTRGQLLGRVWWDFVTSATQKHLRPAFQAALTGAVPLVDVACDFVSAQGIVIPLLLSATVERDHRDDAARIIVVLTNPSPRTHAQRMLRQLSEGTAAYTGGDFFHSLVSHLARVFQARHAMITECTDHTMTRVRTIAYAVDNELIENIEYNLAGTPCAGVIEGAVCYHPEKLAELFPIEVGLESFLGVPIRDSQGAVMGHLAVRDDKFLHVDQSDLDVLQIFATRAGVELERRRAEDARLSSERQLRALNERLADSNRSLEAMVAARTGEIERRRQVAESLRDMVLILNSQRPLSEILDYIVATASQLLGTRSGAIFTLQPDGQTLAIQATHGLPDGFVSQLSLTVSRSLLGQAIEHRQPVVISNRVASQLEQEVNRQALLIAPFQTLLAVPLVRQHRAVEDDEVYGAIAIYYPETRQFSDEEIELAVAFGAQAALAIENAQLRQQAEIGAILEERARLARELHDSVTQQLYSLTLLAEGWRRMAHSGQLDETEAALAELGALGRQALKEMRLLIYELRPPALEQDGLLGALHGRLAAVERRAGMEARLIATDTLDLPAHIEAGLYRIALEALNNTLKHAAATAVTVHLRTENEMVILEVVDNGRGFAPGDGQASGGLGLTSMSERARQLGGSLTICSTPEAGATVRVEVPKGVVHG